MSTSSKLTSPPEIIGVAGTFASGKDLLAHYLSEHYGYTHPSTSELVRNIAMKERGSVERPVLYDVAEKYRKEHGAGVFVQMSLKAPRPTIITGLRSLGEAKAIKAAGGVMVFIDAPIEVRYERMVNRDRDAETQLTLAEFKDFEATEMYSGDDDSDFNLKGIKEMADFVFDSSPSRQEFLHNALEALGIN
jgi:dephospho-CoA kinase